jgi:hypothetical protein
MEERNMEKAGFLGEKKLKELHKCMLSIFGGESIMVQ